MSRLSAKIEKIPEFILACLSVNGEHHYEYGNCIRGTLFQMETNEREILISNLVNHLTAEADNKDMVSNLFIY